MGTGATGASGAQLLAAVSTEAGELLAAHGLHSPSPRFGKRAAPSLHGFQTILQTVLKRERSTSVLDDSSNSGPAIRLYREGRATGPTEDRSRRMEKS
jgi:hypothetical protein